MAKAESIPLHRMEDTFSGIYLTPLAIEKSSRPPYETSQPHRHDFYYCVLLDKGSLELEVDFEQVQLTDHSLFLLYPGQVHRLLSTRMERGWFLAFAPTMLDKLLRDILDQCLAEVIRLPLSAEQSANFCALMQQAFTVYEDKTQPFRQPIMQSLVLAFVYQIAAAYLALEKLTLSRHSVRRIELTKAFKQLLRQNDKSLKRPAEFAAKLHLTVSHLNDTVRAVTGFSVTYYIQQELMREAQRLLTHSDLGVNEIAYTLGFDDTKYFTRLFSKVIGISPGAFRKKEVSPSRLQGIDCLG